MWMRFFAPGIWNKHLIKVHDENMRLAAEKAANDICIDDAFDKDGMHFELKDVDTDTISVVSHQSQPKKLDNELKDVDDSDAVIVEAPSDLDLETAQEEFKDADKDSDADSVESVGSQLARLAASH